ncbi:MAG: chromosome segregation protein SMC [Anaerolineae bacterium]
MRLKTLELQGYKSFATKTVFQFDQGITAVVGPNGSGKSNVADALRWALGEQSYSTLRGKKTEDMIFSGSDGRARLGMAQATLVLDNSDGWLPVDFTEVTIVRRAYRDGQNEYLLNGNRVRLRDINELLAASGLSRRTYTVIGQGLVDAALSLRAEERRMLFEEAAGITLHRSKRADALQKLDATQSNLLRVHDIVTEIEPRLRYLERQAERAAQHQKISTQLKDLLYVWYGYRWGQGQQRLHEARLAATRSQRALDAHLEKLERIGQQIAGLRKRQTELRAQLGEWHRISSHLHNEAETLQRDLAVGEERARLLSAQREELLSEIEPLQVTLKATEERVANDRAGVAHIEQELEAVRSQVEQLRARLGAHHAERQALLDRQSQAESEARELAGRIAGHQARIAQLNERRAQLGQETIESQNAIAAHRQRQAVLQEQLAEKDASLQKLAADLEALETQKDEQLRIIQKLGDRAGELEEEIASGRRRLEALQARQDLLSRMQQDLAGFYEGVRAVLKATRDKSALGGVIGTVAQLLRVPTDLETAIETALGGHLQDIVVETWADAERAIAHLKATHSGRATFLPLDTLRPPEPIQAPDTPGVLGIASDLVAYDGRLAPVARLLLARTLVVEDLPAARRALASMRGGFQIVTRAGELVRSGGSVSGGSVSRDKAGGGFLAREREWRELPATIAEQEKQQQALQSQLEENLQDQANHQAIIEELTHHQARLQAALATLQQERESVTREIERAEEAIQWQQSLLARLEGEQTDLDQREEHLQGEIDEFQRAQTRAQELAHELASQASHLSAEALLTGLSQAQTELAIIEGRLESQRAIQESHEASLTELKARIRAKERRAEELLQERESLLAHLAAQREQVSHLNDQIIEITARIEPAEQELSAMEEQQSALEAKESQNQQMRHRLDTEHSRLSLEFRRRQDELDILRRQIEDDLGLVEVELSEDQVGQPYLPLHPLISQLPSVEELPEGVENDVRRLKLQLGRLGSINPNAPKEYDELRARHQFLTSQMADLEKAATDLRQVITELDRLMEHEFSETFEAVAREFRGYFKRLFGGGEARLVLTDPENIADTGVDIVARPPGKRPQSLNMLSGGERALTAAALIFALLKVSPTPFCVLDEVDAMLDEANVGRFRQELQELAKEIQFIVITHNRRTIEAANTIYGVSMGDDSVSRVISLKLDEVESTHKGQPYEQ